MKTAADKRAAELAAATARNAETEAELKQVAKLFSTAEGKEVLQIMMRRFGVLSSRFQAGSDPIQAAIHDGKTEVVLWITRCLKLSGENNISIPL